nr:MAG TPA: hypothetical protein [Caudoviricetes sp.]
MFILLYIYYHLFFILSSMLYKKYEFFFDFLFIMLYNIY